MKALRTSSKRLRWTVTITLCFGTLIVMMLRSRSHSVALVEASSFGNNTEVNRLLNRGASPSATFHSLQGLGAGEPSIVKHIPIIAAADAGHAETIRILLKNGAAIDATNEWGESALIVACRKNRIEAVRVLVEAGASIHVRCKRGRTPLMWAAGYASPEVVSLLVKHRAPGGVDSIGLTEKDMITFRSQTDRQPVIDALSPTR